MALTKLKFGPLVGDTRSDRVRIWGRVTRTGERLAVRLGIPEAGGAVRWIANAAVSTWPHYDDTGIVEFRDLTPGTTYRYRAAAIDEDPVDWKDLDWGHAPIHEFRTFRTESSSARFVFGSCRHGGRGIGLALTGTGLHARGDHAFKTLQDFIEQGRLDPDLLLMIGDQVYADHPVHSVKFQTPVTKADFQAVYHRAFAWPRFRAVTARVPTFMIYDDHEVQNNWGGHLFGADEHDDTGLVLPEEKRKYRRDTYANGLTFYDAYQSNHSPVVDDLRSLDVPNSARRRYYDFSLADCDFFVMDVRSEREVADKGQPHERNRMISDEQLVRLTQWLGKGKAVKFIVSPVPLFPDTREILGFGSHLELWGHFPAQRRDVIKAIIAAKLDHSKDVYVLSGDVHCSFTAALDVVAGGQDVRLYNIISSPFNWPVFGLNRASFLLDRFQLHGNDSKGDEDVGFEVKRVRMASPRVETANNFTYVAVDPNHVWIDVYGDSGKQLHRLKLPRGSARSWPSSHR